MRYLLNMERLAVMVRSQRGVRGLREVAAEIGDVSPSTLSRVENGNKPDMDTFLALCAWLKVPPAEFFIDPTKHADTSGTSADAISLQLRSDRSLDPATAHVLATLVQAAYRDLSAGTEQPAEEEE